MNKTINKILLEGDSLSYEHQQVQIRYKTSDTNEYKSEYLIVPVLLNKLRQKVKYLRDEVLLDQYILRYKFTYLKKDEAKKRLTNKYDLDDLEVLLLDSLLTSITTTGYLQDTYDVSTNYFYETVIEDIRFPNQEELDEQEIKSKRRYVDTLLDYLTDKTDGLISWTYQKPYKDNSEVILTFDLQTLIKALQPNKEGTHLTSNYITELIINMERWDNYFIHKDDNKVYFIRQENSQL